MLFHVVNERHRRHRTMIFTTNKSLKAWGRVLHDEDLAQAIIDRVLERGRLIRLDGPSVRTLHLNLDEAMKEGSDLDAEVIRISGNRWPEFPEPTAPYSMAGLLSCASVRVFVAWSRSYRRTKEASRFIVSVSDTPRDPGQIPRFTGTVRCTSLLREVVDGECVGEISLCVSMRGGDSLSKRA